MNCWPLITLCTPLSPVLAVRLTPLLSQTTEGSIVTVTIETTHPYESEFHVFLDILNGSALSELTG